MNFCQECAKIQKTCCQGEGFQVALTKGDIRRIGMFTSSPAFYELKAVEEPLRQVYTTPEHYGDDEKIYVQYLFDEAGRRNVLKKKPNNAECLFLSKSGCGLPFEVKPLICRIYPYNWNDELDLWLETDYCPAPFFQNPDYFRSVPLSEGEAKKLVSQFYFELITM